jgi:hypothetical protein
MKRGVPWKFGMRSRRKIRPTLHWILMNGLKPEAVFICRSSDGSVSVSVHMALALIAFKRITTYRL